MEHTKQSQPIADGTKGAGGWTDRPQSPPTPHGHYIPQDNAADHAPEFAPFVESPPPWFVVCCARAVIVRLGDANISAWLLAFFARQMQDVCHNIARRAGWWTTLDGANAIDNPLAFSNKLMLTVSELAEAMEGDRKNLKDDKLPHRDMREVELADAIIRIFDLAGAYGMDLGGAIAEKLHYNQHRPDHKPENRAKAGGKAY